MCYNFKEVIIHKTKRSPSEWMKPQLLGKCLQSFKCIIDSLKHSNLKRVAHGKFLQQHGLEEGWEYLPDSHLLLVWLRVVMCGHVAGMHICGTCVGFMWVIYTHTQYPGTCSSDVLQFCWGLHSQNGPSQTGPLPRWSAWTHHGAHAPPHAHLDSEDTSTGPIILVEYLTEFEHRILNTKLQCGIIQVGSII